MLTQDQKTMTLPTPQYRVDTPVPAPVPRVIQPRTVVSTLADLPVARRKHWTLRVHDWVSGGLSELGLMWATWKDAPKE